eukprot:g6849.t1
MPRCKAGWGKFLSRLNSKHINIFLLVLLLVILGLNYNGRKTNLSYFNLKTHLNGDIGEEALELRVTSSLLKHYALQEKVLELRKANNEIIHEILRKKKLLNQNGTSEFVEEPHQKIDDRRIKIYKEMRQAKSQLEGLDLHSFSLYFGGKSFTWQEAKRQYLAMPRFGKQNGKNRFPAYPYISGDSFRAICKHRCELKYGNYVDRSSGGPNEFTSIFSCFWLIIITITTVGYGDISPSTESGKIVCVAAMIFGILYTAMPLAIVGSFFFDAYDGQLKDLEDPKKTAEKLDKLLTDSARAHGKSFLDNGLKLMSNAKKKFGEMLLEHADSRSRSGTLTNANDEYVEKSLASTTTSTYPTVNAVDEEKKVSDEEKKVSDEEEKVSDEEMADMGLGRKKVIAKLQLIINDVTHSLAYTHGLAEMVQCISTKFNEREFTVHKEV